MAYITCNPRTKKQVKQELKDGKRLEVYQLTPYGRMDVIDQEKVYLEGPHYPEPHRWYGVAKVKAGVIVSFK